MNKVTLGSPVKSDLKRNCLLCSKWLMCRDPNKDMDYACTRFTTEFDASVFDVIEEDKEHEERQKKKKAKNQDSIKNERLGFNSSVNITDKHIKEDSIYELISDVLDSGNPLPPDLKINDRDIPKPANIIDWMTKEEFIGGDQQPFAKQMQIALHFMAEWCPRCSDESYIEDIPVADTLDDIKSNVVFLRNGKCPRCKATKYDLVTNEELTDPIELISILGQRSGKSVLSTMIESYNISRWVTTPNLPAAFKVLQSSVFTGTYTATTFGQAKGSFWDPLNAILLDSNWYKQYHKFLTEEGYKLGEELYKHSETILTYRHKNLIFAPASPSQRSLRGRTRVSCFPKGTKIKTENGLFDISDPNIVGKQAEFLGQKGKITKWFDNGVRDTVIVKTSLGTKIKTTADHKFVVFDKLTERFTKKKIKNIKPTDKFVISLGHNFPEKSPELPKLDDSKYVGKSTDTVYENTLKRMYELKSFDYRDFPEISQNLFYVYTSALRRKGVLNVTYKKKRIPGEPTTNMVLSTSLSYEELRESLLSMKRRRGSENSNYRRWSEELRKTTLPTHMNVELAWILGTMISDGKYCYSDVEFEYVNTKLEYIERFSSYFEKCFGVKPRINGPYQPKEENKLPYWCVRFGTKYLKDFFRELGLKEGSWAGKKRIPDIFWKATKEECLAFISGMWDGDGTGISSYSSTSKHLLNDLQQLLFMLGIVSKVEHPKLYKDGNYKFSTKLGYLIIRSAYDKYKLIKLASKYSLKIGSQPNIRIRDIRRGYHTKNTYSYPVRKVRNHGNRNSSIESIWLDSRLNKKWDKHKNEIALIALRTQDEYHAEYLSNWIDKEIAFCDLVSIKRSRPQKVYDITVDNDKHVYTVGGGYLASNCVVDEAGWFRIGQKKQGGDFERMNGNEVYAALRRSLTTMRVSYQKRFEQGYYNLPKPTFSMISSPSARNDLIMTRFRKSQGSKEAYILKEPTWRVNPDLPREAFNEEFRTDYTAAIRDYGCEPPMSSNPWIKDEELIENSFGKQKNAILTTTKRIKTKSKKLATSGHYKITRRVAAPLGGGSILGLDAGFSNNSFAFCIAFPTSIPDVDDEEEENVLVGMEVAAVGEIIPKKDYPISFTSIYRNILQPLCEEFNVAVVISDSWQNKKIQQDLEDSLGISYYELKVGMQDFIDYKDGMYHETITHPKLDMKFKEISEMTLEDYPHCFSKSPVAHLAFQMMTVQNTGTAVVKGEEGTTDDILRSCVVCHAGLQDEEILEEVLSFSVTSYVPKSALGSVALGSGGGPKYSGATSLGVVSSYSGTAGPVSSGNNIGVVGRKR